MLKNEAVSEGEQIQESQALGDPWRSDSYLIASNGYRVGKNVWQQCVSSNPEDFSSHSKFKQEHSG